MTRIYLAWHEKGANPGIVAAHVSIRKVAVAAQEYVRAHAENYLAQLAAGAESYPARHALSPAMLRVRLLALPAGGFAFGLSDAIASLQYYEPGMHIPAWAEIHQAEPYHHNLVWVASKTSPFRALLDADRPGDPIRDFALAALSGDPLACDAIRDVLRG